MWRGTRPPRWHAGFPQPLAERQEVKLHWQDPVTARGLWATVESLSHAEAGGCPCPTGAQRRVPCPSGGAEEGSPALTGMQRRGPLPWWGAEEGPLPQRGCRGGVPCLGGDAEEPPPPQFVQWELPRQL